mgnify:CR=1 FL=1
MATNGTQRHEEECWNPRYGAYAAAHGLAPDEMLREDAAKFPGGRMAGYLVWMNARWQEWRALHGIKPNAFLSTLEHDDFDAWIAWRRGREAAAASEMLAGIRVACRG